MKPRQRICQRRRGKSSLISDSACSLRRAVNVEERTRCDAPSLDSPRVLLGVVAITLLAGLTAVSQTATPPNAQTRPDGDGSIAITGELKRWHKVTLTLNGPFARETDNDPNPFVDYRMTATFVHESGSPSNQVPGYFAADGKASETSANAGDKWRAHLSPDKPGRWTYKVSFVKGKGIALDSSTNGEP